MILILQNQINIDTIVMIGCTNGRDFIPFFNKNFNLIGFDIFDKNDIDFVNDIKINYIKINDNSQIIDILTKLNINLSNTLFTSNFTLYRTPHIAQEIINFFENIIINEPIQGDYSKPIYLNDFTNLSMIKNGWDRINSSHIICKLNISEKELDNYLKEAICPT